MSFQVDRMHVAITEQQNNRPTGQACGSAFTRESKINTSLS
jgi:hypothetical protein